MIEIKDNHTMIKGTNLDILTDVIGLVDAMLKTHPEIINAVVAGYVDKLAKSIDTCNPAILALLVKIVEDYNERK